MPKNFPNLERGKATHVQEAQRVPIKMNPKKHTPRHIIIKMANFKDNKRILKAAREKQLVTYKGALIRLSADFFIEIYKPEGLARNIPSNEKQRPTTKITLARKPLN